MFKANKKNVKSHNVNQKEILETEESVVKVVFQTLASVFVLVVALSAILYTVLWFTE